MEALQATPQTLQEVFTYIYFIPEYQRPYSWGKDECEKLWEDLYSFFESKSTNNDKYFLGNIVLYEENGNYCVVDGQQRLISLSLLMRALFEKVMTFNSLERCLFIIDDETGENTEKHHIISNVIDEERENLENVLVKKEIDSDTLYAKNYKLFSECLEKWIDSLGANKTKLKEFIRVLLNNVVLLPIKCGDLDDALTIFETINNRGMSLSDIDIFKAQLHKNAGQNSKEFIRRWNEIENDYNDIFRIYMYILRAKDKITDKEIGLRPFFLSTNLRLKDWKTVIHDMEKIDSCINYHEGACPDVESCEGCIKYKICKWFQILWYYPNQYWQYPIYTFLFKFLNSDGELTKEKIEEYSLLLQDTIRYCYVKSIIYNSVNTIKDVIFRVCANIWHGKDYKRLYYESLAKDNFEIKSALEAGKVQRSLRGLCFLHAYLNPDQVFIPWEAQIEHILPKKWNNYDGWTEETYQNDVNKIGNLVVLEKKLNISAKNEFFSRKKDVYKNSEVIAAKNLCDIQSWTPDTLDKRHKNVIKELTSFLRSDQ